MKRFTASLIFALCLTCVAANAQNNFHIGARAGYTAAWIPGTISELGGQVLPHSNFYGGVFGDYLLGDLFLMSLGAEYCGKGYHTKLALLPGVNERQKLDLGYVQIPLLFGVSLHENKINLSIGPEFDILCVSKASYETPNAGAYKNRDVRKLCSKFDVGIAAQMNYMILDALGIDLRFTWGMNKTFLLDKVESLKNEHGHNLAVQIGLCYKFEL